MRLTMYIIHHAFGWEPLLLGYNHRVNHFTSRRAAFAGVLLLAISPLFAQTGSARIRVADATGAAIPEAKVSLVDGLDGTVGTLSTDDAGEVLWTDLPLGDAHFFASARGFRHGGITVTIRTGDGQKVAMVLEVAPIEAQPDLKTIQMPYSDKLDLLPEPSPPPPQPKPAKRHWWQIFR